MKKQILALVLILCTGIFTSNAQKTVSGVKLENTLTLESQSLTLNGAGLREKYWIDLYVGSLYLPKKSSNASEIINSTEAAAIKLNIVSGMITSDKLISSINDGFKNATGGKTAAISKEIATFKAILKEKIVKGDVFIFMNVPGSGIVIYKNGVKKGTIEGQEFKKALFGIWLSTKPADEDLKNGMLGK